MPVSQVIPTNFVKQDQGSNQIGSFAILTSQLVSYSDNTNVTATGSNLYYATISGGTFALGAAIPNGQVWKHISGNIIQVGGYGLFQRTA